MSYNLYAYCLNNPVMGYDPAGTLDFGKLFNGSRWLAVGVSAVVLGISVLTCGVAMPAMTALAAVTVTSGAATTINGLSEFCEIITGYNFVRDGVFNGNSKMYNIYSYSIAAIAEVGTAVCGGWLKTNSPRIQAYKNVESYQYTNTISDMKHMSRPYANSVLMQKEVIKYGKMVEDSFGYVFSVIGSLNGKTKQWRLGINIAKKIIWHWGHGF